MASAELIADIEAGNLRKCISEADYTMAMEPAYLELKAKYGDISNIRFDPDKHLRVIAGGPVENNMYENTRRLTMEELGLSNKKQISPIGVSDPFPLFTDEAIDIMKLELLEKENVLEHGRDIFNVTPGEGLNCVFRGWVKNNRKVQKQFTHDAWTHPKTMELISTVAGVELEIVMDVEISHINYSMTPPEVAERERAEYQKLLELETQKGENLPAVVGWHTDSPPFVCVLMMSDTSLMIGGETYLRMGNGDIACVPGPRKGYAAILQGHLIQHLALKPRGSTERITLVTSLRAKDPLVTEDSVLSTVKPEVNYGSRYHDYYPEWIDYRVEIMKARLDHVAKTWNESKTFNKSAAIDQLKQIEAYLAKTYTEMEVSPEEWAEIMSRE